MRKLLVTLAMAIFTVGFGGLAVSEETILPHEDRYAPKQWGLPDVIGDYSILAAVTKNDAGCMMSGERRLILQAQQPTIDEALRAFPTDRLTTELPGWGWSLVGPGLTREQVSTRLEQSSLSHQPVDCPVLALPNPAELVLLEGELKQPPDPKNPMGPPGFTIITNGDAGPTKNAQSVVLVAPNINNNQDHAFIKQGDPGPLTAFLNNVVTDEMCANEPCFLQVGFTFQRYYDLFPTVGEVRWTDTLHGLNKQPFNPSIPYTEGHNYYTTITFTSGVWWMCAMDLSNTASYQCEISGINGRTVPGKMRHDLRTSIFAENYSTNDDWWHGWLGQYVDVVWNAYDAKVYTPDNNPPQPWSYQKVSTDHACLKNWPAEAAVFGNLDNYGSANIHTQGMPLRCSGATTDPTDHKPVITEVKFPSAIYGDDKIVDGRVKFRDDNGGVNLAQFDVVPGTCSGCTPFSFDPEVGAFIEGWFHFEMWCTTKTGFSWTMQVTLKDKDGNKSDHKTFSIECKPPAIAEPPPTASPPPKAR
jgi:hypothetical protein